MTDRTTKRPEGRFVIGVHTATEHPPTEREHYTMEVTS